MSIKMNGIRLTKKTSTEQLQPQIVDRPQIEDGFILIEVKAFGVNESEITSRKGESSPDFTFPRILGIEGAGIVAEVNPGSSLNVGQKVITMMGGLGREFDGSYAEYMIVREENVIPFESDLGWEVIGALPEMLQTAYGSLTQGLHLEEGDKVLIHGGSSTVGMMAAVLAKQKNVTVISTTRTPQKIPALKKLVWIFH